MTEKQTFGQAIEAVKNGRAISREDWNDKGMLVYLHRGSTDRTGQDQSHYEGVAGALLDTGDTGTVTRLPNLNLKTAAGSTVTGWLASQTDLLAEDWCILD